MLKYLSIRDFVIVESLELDFSSGFTALTGETGAGKSILIDALSLALGERGDAGMVRAGCERAEIAAEFDTAALPQLQSWLLEQDLQGDDGVCLLRRTLDSGGRSRGFINGSSATLQQMRLAGAFLLDIHGQHAHQSLLLADAQRDLLDSHAGLGKDSEQVAECHKIWLSLASPPQPTGTECRERGRRARIAGFSAARTGNAEFYGGRMGDFAGRSLAFVPCCELAGDRAVRRGGVERSGQRVFGPVECTGDAAARRVGVRCGSARHADHTGKHAERIAGGGVCLAPLSGKTGCRSAAVARAGATHRRRDGGGTQIPREAGTLAASLGGHRRASG